MDYFDTLEFDLCLRINALSRRRFVRQFFTVVSKLGDYPAWIAIGLICAARQDGPVFVFVLQALVTAGVGILLYKLLKERLVRERPYITHGEIVAGTPPLDRYSFPSGHTLHAVAFTILFGAYDPTLLGLLIPFTLLVAASRIILGLHYPSDVIVGGALGAATASSSLAIVS